MFEFYPQVEYPLAATQISLALLGMGMELTADDFRRVLAQRRALLLGFFVQLVLVPLFALVLVTLADPDPGVAVGLCLMAAVPGGAASNVFVYLARASVALSISLTAVTTVLALVTTPIVLKLLAGAHLPAQLVMPTQHILREIALFLLAPLSVGLLLRARLGPAVLVWSRRLVRASLLVLALIVVGSLGSGRIDPMSEGWFTPLLVIVLCAGSAQIGLGAGKVFRLVPADRYAIALESGMRNAGLALLISASLFPPSVGRFGDQAMFVVLFFGGTALAVSGSIVVRGRRVIAARST